MMYEELPARVIYQQDRTYCPPREIRGALPSPLWIYTEVVAMYVPMPLGMSDMSTLLVASHIRYERDDSYIPLPAKAPEQLYVSTTVTSWQEAIQQALRIINRWHKKIDTWYAAQLKAEMGAQQHG